MPPDLLEVHDVAAGVRRRMVNLALEHRGAYLAQTCSSAEIFAALYTGLMHLTPSNAKPIPDPLPGVPCAGLTVPWGGEYNGQRTSDGDRFILSPAHYAATLYATLVESGRLDEAALQQYSQNGAVLEMIGSEHSPGMEATTGSLAQGLSVGVGVALARTLTKKPGTVWVLITDGELEEGQTWEALAAAAHYSLGNLVVLVDANGLQVDGPPATVLAVEPIAEKVRAFGWTTLEVNGHDPAAITDAAISRVPDRPTCIVCRTVPWHGLPSLKSRYPAKLHFVRFKPGEDTAVLDDVENIRLSELHA
jgi:transketolase